MAVIEGGMRCSRALRRLHVLANRKQQHVEATALQHLTFICSVSAAVFSPLHRFAIPPSAIAAPHCGI